VFYVVTAEWLMCMDLLHLWQVRINDGIILICFALQLVMEKFRKYEKQALDLHSKKKAEREENVEKKKAGLAQKKKEEESRNTKEAASITELTDDEAFKLQKEIDEVYANVSFLTIYLIFVSSVQVNTTARSCGMRSANALILA
jgi:ribosomal protein S25